MSDRSENNNHEQQRQDEQTLRAIRDVFADVPRGRVVWRDVLRMLGDAPPVLLTNWAKEKGYNARAFNDAVRAYRAEVEMGRPILSCSDLVDAVVEQNGVSVTYAGMIDRKATGRVQAPYNLTNLTDDVISASARLQLGYRDSLVRADIGRWQQRSRDATLTRVVNALSDDNADRCAGQWAALGRALVMPESSGGASADYVAAVLQTAVWQVKRKLAGLPVTGHLMPILTGTQGNGKSTFLRAFFKPVEELAVFANFTEAFDSRNIDIWNNFVLIFDEMEKADKADINAVKAAITGETTSARMMNTNSTAVVRNRATLAGAMNGSVGAVLRDPTGMRRYAPVPTGHKPGAGRSGEVDWAALGTLDYAALWRSVRVDDARPADRVQPELALLQHAETAVDPVVHFLREHFDAAAYPGGSVSATDLHRDYSAMMLDHFPSHHRANIQSFGMKLTGFEAEDWYPFSRKERGRRGSQYIIATNVAENDTAPTNIAAIRTRMNVSRGRAA